MKCPACKKATLSVARTYGEGTRTLRDRRCPKCNTYHKTIEIYETELNRMIEEKNNVIQEGRMEKTAVEDKLYELKGAIKTLFDAVKPVEPSSRPRSRKR
ncbi:MAG: hypothetical protein HY884_05370 [Deltaproteobacteria bacterium]|nr:hypothetical protein [Deltaproteobacteria bacterium]